MNELVTNQLSLFKDAPRNIPNSDLVKLKELAVSGQENIDVCCSLLEMYNYDTIRKAVFVLRCIFEETNISDWVDQTVGAGTFIMTSIKIDDKKIIIYDGFVNSCSLRCYCKMSNSDELFLLYNYDDYLENEERDRPTAKVRSIQLKTITKLLLNFWK